MRSEKPIPLDGAFGEGHSPKPLRKKGFYRAWRRHELLAIEPYLAYQTVSAQNMFARIEADANCPSDQMFVLYPNDWKRTR
jgi:hypothetical protein